MTAHICPACKGIGCEQCCHGIVKIPDDIHQQGVIFSGHLAPFPSENDFGRRAWMFIAHEKKDGENIRLPILPGDFLTIEENGVTIFGDTIVMDSEVGQQPHPGNPIRTGQKALGHWIPWVQKGVPPEIWAGFFIRETPLLAVLTKNSDEGYL